MGTFLGMAYMKGLPGVNPGILMDTFYGVLLLGPLLFGGSVFAESAEYDDSVEEITLVDGVISAPLPAEELEELVAPIALYPDDLLGLVLPASTYPLQIVQAARYLEARKDDENLEPDKAWDESIVALLNYPEVLNLLNSDLNWTWKLGEAVLNQHKDVIIAVTGFRELARVAGNLGSDKYQTVAVLTDGAIEIRPANPEEIYVPYYDPLQVIAYSPGTVYHYYPRPYPVYYYPYPAEHKFSWSIFWGVTSAFTISWRDHHLHLHHFGYDGHPYSGHRYNYNSHYYRRPVVSTSYDQTFNYHHDRNRHRHHAGNYWRPKHNHAGVRPRSHDTESTRTGRHTIVQSTDHRDHLARSRDTSEQSQSDQPQQKKQKELMDNRLVRIEQHLELEREPSVSRVKQNYSPPSLPTAQPKKSQSSLVMKKTNITRKSFRTENSGKRSQILVIK